MVFFPRREWQRLRDEVLSEILEERLPERRFRFNHRGVKKKMTNFPIANRAEDRTLRGDPRTQIKLVRGRKQKKVA